MGVICPGSSADDSRNSSGRGPRQSRAWTDLPHPGGNDVWQSRQPVNFRLPTPVDKSRKRLAVYRRASVAKRTSAMRSGGASCQAFQRGGGRAAWLAAHLLGGCVLAGAANAQSSALLYGRLDANVRVVHELTVAISLLANGRLLATQLGSRRPPRHADPQARSRACGTEQYRHCGGTSSIPTPCGCRDAPGTPSYPLGGRCRCFARRMSGTRAARKVGLAGECLHLHQETP